jgi:ClpP class serine protease
MANLANLFWLFFMLSAIQPSLQQRLLEAARARRIARFERKRGSRVIAMVHRQETMRLLGFPVARYIDINDSEDILRAIRMTDKDVPIDIVLHTPGGLLLAALQIARALREHPAKVTAFVPHHAARDMLGGRMADARLTYSLTSCPKEPGRTTIRSRQLRRRPWA